jgi:anti-anti-sigma factor
MADATFTVEAAQSGQTFVIRLYGELDPASQPAFDESVSSLFNGHSDVLLDLSGLTITGSSGLHGLINLRNALRDQGEALILTRGNQDGVHGGQVVLVGHRGRRRPPAVV